MDYKSLSFPAITSFSLLINDSVVHLRTQLCELTAFGAAKPPVVMAMPVESSNRSFRPLLTAGGAGVGDGANVLGTDEGMKFCPT